MIEWGLGINTRPEDYALAVGGDINFTGTLYNNGSEFSSSVFSLNGTNAYYSAGNVGIRDDITNRFVTYIQLEIVATQF